MTDRTERIATFLSKDEAEKIKAAATEKGLSVSAFIRVAAINAAKEPQQ